MTTKSKRSHINLGRLKVMIAVGGLAATMMGAELLSRAENPNGQAPPPAAIIIPEDGDNEAITLDFRPIPKLAIPEPIAQSRSSM